MINKVILIGNLGADPEVRTLDSGTKVAKLSLATNENYRDRTTNEWKSITEWHNVILWRFLADNAERQLKKGSLVYIEGKLTSRKYQDKDGNDRYITEVVANVMRSLDRREDSGQGGYFPPEESDPFAKKSSPTSPPSPQHTQHSPGSDQTSAGHTSTDADQEEEEDDLPF